MLEKDYQRKLISKLETQFPNCLILKNDPNYIQGIPDLTILYKNKYALLEVKKSSKENVQPNQEYYLTLVSDNGGFAEFINPENEKEVIHELKEYFK